MARDKVYASAEAALADVFEGAVLLVGGFAGRGVPEMLLRALARTGVGGLTCVCSPYSGQYPAAPGSSLDRLVAGGQVRKLVSPLPVYPGRDGVIRDRWQAGDLEVEVVPQGTLAERLRAGGAGLGGVFLPTGGGARFQDGKERRILGGVETVLELPLRADFALISAQAADSLGNLVYIGAARNWAPVMAMAARVSVVETSQLVEPGEIDPERVITPGIFVNRIVRTAEA